MIRHMESGSDQFPGDQEPAGDEQIAKFLDERFSAALVEFDAYTAEYLRQDRSFG